MTTRTLSLLTLLLLTLFAFAGCSKPNAETTTPPPEAPMSPTDLRPPMPTEAMIQKILARTVIEDSRVAKYLHLENPANLPLKVFAAKGLDEGVVDLKIGGQRVSVVDEASARVVLSGRERVEGPNERVLIKIPAEGLSGHVDLTLADYVWSVTDVKLVER